MRAWVFGYYLAGSVNLTLLVATTAAAAVDFAAEVYPLLERTCCRCHGAEAQKGRLRLDARATALAGGLLGRAIVPGKSEESLAYRYAAGLDPDVRMPPSGSPLAAGELETFKRWIDEGAAWPEGVGPQLGAAGLEATRPWAFRPVRRLALPAPRRAGWARGAIDLFVLARLESAGLDPGPEADRATLIRRATLDLHGLPPSPEEVDRFVADPEPDAHDRLVDRLLASPRHGERWARHWLDVVRFAETHGFEMNQPRPNAWPYRDYLIAAFNADKPYDALVREQLAGDRLGADAATGFIVGGPWDQVKSPDPVLTAEQRMNELHDMVATTGTAFLGLTVGCARCHHHKFDPISQRDYYALQAVFAGVEHGEREVMDGDPRAHEAAAEGLRQELARIDAELWQLEPLARREEGAGVRRSGVSYQRNVDRFSPLEAVAVRFTVLAATGAEPCIDELEVYTAGGGPRNVALASAGARPRASSTLAGFPIHKLEHVNDGQYGNAQSWISAEAGSGWVEIELAGPARIDRIAWGRDREGKFKDRLATAYRIEARTPEGAWVEVATHADRALPGEAAPGVGSPAAGLQGRRQALEAEIAALTARPRAYTGAFKPPAATHRLHRGDPMQRRELVTPGAIAALASPLDVPAEAADADRRAALAGWIASPANPLAARVIVNRLWQHHFGEGIVSTPDDFGASGSGPSHPELLDWLAAELVERSWSLKAIHRLILRSSAYRQASAPRPEAVALDAGSRLLWRFPPRRVEAEVIHDAMLQASGVLDLRMGGPGFSAFEPNDNYVRVYKPRSTFGPPEWRRMIYMTKVRSQQDGTFGVFDCPDAGQTCPKRTRSTTALQSLNLLNAPFALEQARLLAGRLEREAGPDREAQARHAFRILFQRQPDAVELEAAARFIAEHGLAAFARVLFNANELLFLS